MSNAPTLISGGLALDDRGEVAFANDFHFEGVKRFYLVRNHRVGFVRAWHAHAREAKYVLAVSGTALIGAVKVEDLAQPDKAATPLRFVLSASKPAILFIPAGYANGAMSLTEDCTLLYFSTATLEQSREDDVRYHARFWDIWSVEER